MSSLKKLAIRGAFWTIAGYGASLMLRFGSNLILTRLLEPKLFGFIGLVWSHLLNSGSPNRFIWEKKAAEELFSLLLREHRWHEIDVVHLIEEIEDLGKSERRGISSQLTRLLLHLLKWQYSQRNVHTL